MEKPSKKRPKQEKKKVLKDLNEDKRSVSPIGRNKSAPKRNYKIEREAREEMEEEEVDLESSFEQE